MREYFTTIFTFSKILLLELWTKILLANQIAGFLKTQYLKKEPNNKVYLHADRL